MDALEQLLRDTLADAARSAPAPNGLPERGPRFRRPPWMPAVLVAAAAAAVVAAAAVLTGVISHDGSARMAESGGRVGGAHGVVEGAGGLGQAMGGSQPRGTPYPLAGGVFLSRDRHTLYGLESESTRRRGHPCWTYVNGSATVRADGLVAVGLYSRTVGLPDGSTACHDMGVGGLWYVAVPLPTAYHRSYVIDSLTGKPHRILGTVSPRPGQVVNG